LEVTGQQVGSEGMAALCGGSAPVAWIRATDHRKVADLLAGQASQSLDVPQLVDLLREQLSAEQLHQLREQLSG